MKLRALRRLVRPERLSESIYAMFAEADRGRVWNGKRWVRVDPRAIVEETRRSMAEEVR